MNVKKSSVNEDEIDLIEIILAIWDAKYLIVTLSLLFAIFGYVIGFLYEKSQPNVYQIKLNTREAPSALFVKYETYNIQDYNRLFKQNFLSLDNLAMFSEQYDNIVELKSYLKEKNIDFQNFFKNKLKLVDDKKSTTQYSNTYILTYYVKFIPKEFLYDYVYYIKQIVDNIILEQSLAYIEERINILNFNLEIAKNLKIEKPLQITITERSYNNNFRVPNNMFFLGSKALSAKLLNLEQLLEETKDLKSDYNPIIDITESQLPKNKKNFIPIGLLIGIFLSLIIIFIKKQLQRKS